MNTRGYTVGTMSLLTQNAENKKNNKFWTLVYIREGSGMYIIDGRLTCLNETDLLFLPPTVRYSFEAKDLGDEYNESVNAVIFRFNESWMDAFLGVFHTYGDIILSLKGMKDAVSVNGPKWMKISSLLNDISSCEPHKEAGVILELLTLLADPQDMYALTSLSDASLCDTQEKLARIDRFISCNLTRGFSLEEIAGYAGMNRTYFCLFFKKHYNISLIEHVNRLKVDKACNMLLKTDMSVSEVSKECGFTNVTYFNRVFKAIKGMSPREFTR